MTLRSQKGFGVAAIIIVGVVLVLCGLLVWRLVSTATSPSNSQVPRAGSGHNRVAIEEWGVYVPASDKYEIALSSISESSIYDGAVDSVQLSLPALSDKFICSESDGSQIAGFATIVRYEQTAEIKGPFTPVATKVTGDKKYALYPTGHNCYEEQTKNEVESIFNAYKAAFNVENKN